MLSTSRYSRADVVCSAIPEPAGQMILKAIEEKRPFKWVAGDGIFCESKKHMLNTLTGCKAYESRLCLMNPQS